MFAVRDHALELRRRSGEDADVDKSWINRVPLVAEGLALEPYIHLDIRTPFGETVHDQQVEEALAESLGPKKEKYRLCGWHVQFVEDTNLGSNHRVFVDLRETPGESGSETGQIATPREGTPGMDSRLSLELAMEALGERVSEEKGEATFQLIFTGTHYCYSLLHVNGAPFHVLRIGEASGNGAAERLARHREFAFSQGKSGIPMRTFLFKGDAAADLEPIRSLRPEILDFGFTDPALYLHLGLAQAARKKDFTGHNRAGEGEKRRNSTIRTRHRFWRATLATSLACLGLALFYGESLRSSKRQLQGLKSQAAAYQAQVASIKALRREKAALETSLQDLRPIWRKPLAWKSIFASITSALPREAGIDGLAVNADPEGGGGQELSFRVWIKDWDQVQAIQKRLSASPHFSSVVLSEQRKDLAAGVVVFNVTCALERM